MPKETKTNALRLLERAGLHYDTISYDPAGGIDGVSVAKQVDMPLNMAYKTLLTKGASGGCYVFVIPVAAELSLKKAACAAGEKSVTMAPQGELLALTGYVKGGCSPVGMKKPYPTFIHTEAQNLKIMGVSAGRIGLELLIAPHALAKIISANFVDLVQD